MNKNDRNPQTEDGILLNIPILIKHVNEATGLLPNSDDKVAVGQLAAKLYLLKQDFDNNNFNIQRAVDTFSMAVSLNRTYGFTIVPVQAFLDYFANLQPIEA